MSVKIHVWGDYALFSRPEMKVERCSYDVMTPSAARGILEAVYWHPGLMWIIDKIYVCKPIQFTNIRRNEIKSKISANNVLQVMNGADKELYVSAKDDIVQRASLMLRDVEYVIEAHFNMTEKALIIRVNFRIFLSDVYNLGNAIILHILVHESALSILNHVKRIR